MHIDWSGILFFEIEPFQILQQIAKPSLHPQQLHNLILSLFL